MEKDIKKIDGIEHLIIKDMPNGSIWLEYDLCRQGRQIVVEIYDRMKDMWMGISKHESDWGIVPDGQYSKLNQLLVEAGI